VEGNHEERKAHEVLGRWRGNHELGELDELVLGNRGGAESERRRVAGEEVVGNHELGELDEFLLGRWSCEGVVPVRRPRESSTADGALD
jgi:hypothetical protein